MMINPEDIFRACDDSCCPDGDPAIGEGPCTVCTLRAQARDFLVKQQAAIAEIIQQIDDFRPFTNAFVGGDAFWDEMNKP